MFVEWRCIQSAAVCFVYTPDESFSKHAIHVLLNFILACIREIPALIHAGIALIVILVRTRAVNPKGPQATGDGDQF